MGALDLEVLQWLHDHRTPAMTAAMQLWSDLNGNWAMIAWAALFAGYLLWQCRYDWAFTVAAAVPGIELLNALVKVIVKRPRPAFDIALEQYQTYSFPSGHVAVSTVFYGLVAAYVIAHVQSVGVRAASVAAAACLVALVGVSRMYLGVHYPTDVLGALLEGLAWIALGLALRRRIAPRIDKVRKEA
jgi:membrane-associated phospholipid phosphatase